MNESELSDALLALPEPDGNDFWSERRRDLRRAANQESLDNFLNWATIRGTMFVGTGAPWTGDELAYLRAQPDWVQVWQAAMVDPPVGNPPLLPGTRFSGNTVEQAYHLCLWQNTTGLKIADLHSIVEIGGGYGAMRYLVDRLGFRGRYLLYDSPEYLQLQRYYLGQLNLAAQFMDEDELIDLVAPIQSDLLIAACSLSEMPFVTRHIVLRALPASHYLIRYQGGFEGMDNGHWFVARFAGLSPAYRPGPEFLDHTYLIT